MIAIHGMKPSTVLEPSPSTSGSGAGIAKLGRASPAPPSAKVARAVASAAAAAVENSPLEEGRAAGDIAIKLDRRAAGYPIVLVSYVIACSEYQDAEKAALVKGYLSLIVSEEGQSAAAETAGSAPLSDTLREKVIAAVDSIK